MSNSTPSSKPQRAAGSVGCLGMLLRFFALACFALSLAVFWLLPPEPLVRLSPCQALAGWSSDGTKLTVVGLPVGGAWQVQQWDLQNGRLVNSLPLPAHEFQSDNPACFSEIVAGGALLANGRSSLGDHSTSPLRVWNLEQRKFWREFQTTGGDYFVRPVAFSADGGWMAIQVPSDQNQPSIDLWRVSEDRRISTIAGFHAPLALSADGRWLAATDDLHQVGLFNAETGEQVERTKAHTFPVGSLAFSPDGRWLASAANGANRSEDSRPAEVSLHEVPQLRTAVSWNLPGSTSGKLEFTPDGRFLSARDAVFGSKATWNVSGEVSKNTIGIPGPSVLSPDGRRRAVVSVVSGNQVILPLIDANENSATQVASDKTQTSPAKLSTRWPQGCSLAPIAFSPEGQSLAVRVQRRPEIGDHLKGLATGNRPDQLLIAETWVVDVESGTPSAVIPGQSTSQSLYVAPERLLLFELESQATVVPGISPVLWTTAPHRSIVKSVFVVLSGVVPVAWRWRRKRHAGN